MKLVTAIILIAVLTGCGSDSSPQHAGSGNGLIDALCTVRADAERADTARASTDYYDHAHDRLHLLAATVARDDRPLAGRLLEAHQLVEDDLAAGRTGDTLTGHVDTLVERARTAVAATGHPEPDRCPT